MPGTGQQEITTFAQAAHAAQRGRKPEQRRRGRPLAAVYVSRLRKAQPSGPYGVRGKIIMDFERAGGFAALAGRQAVVTMTHAELAEALKALPANAEGVPDTVTASIVILRAWLLREAGS